MLLKTFWAKEKARGGARLKKMQTETPINPMKTVVKYGFPRGTIPPYIN